MPKITLFACIALEKSIFPGDLRDPKSFQNYEQSLSGSYFLAIYCQGLVLRDGANALLAVSRIDLCNSKCPVEKDQWKAFEVGVSPLCVKKPKRVSHETHTWARSEELQNESSPEVVNFHPEFCTEKML